MILAVWIAMRMTFIAIEGDLAPGQSSLGVVRAEPVRTPPGVLAGSGADRRAAHAAVAQPDSGTGTGTDPITGWPEIAPFTPFPDYFAGAGFAQVGPVSPRESAPRRLRRWWEARKAQALAAAAVRVGPGMAMAAGEESGAGVPWLRLTGSGASFPRAFTGPVYGFRPDPGQTGAAFRQPLGGPAGAAAPLPVAAAGSGRVRRWSADGWVLLRGGDSAPALAAGAASYGGSQAGAVLRYRLAPASPLVPQAYLRVSGALGGTSGQAEAALGLMLRPVPRLPVALLGEVRVQNQGGRSVARPVIMGVTQLPPQRLPLGFEGEAYAQGGWAGGRDATAFYDLAATVQRPLIAPLKGLDFRAGGGLWSGGQRGAARLDLGPRIELRSMIGPEARRIGVRVGVDWRFRVAGKAEPGSGPALTVAAGF
jgi:hypothetical protein